MPPIPQTEDGEIRGAVALSASIGRGRHGETFEAELGLEEAVAAKRFFLGAGWDVGVFKAEAKAAQLLAGVPYVVTVLGYKTEGGPPLLLSTLAAGALSDVLGGASTAQKLLLLTQAAVGLAGLHAFGAVHGDLSSNSLLLSGEGEMRVKGGGFVRTRRAVDRGLLGTAGHANAEVAIQAYSAPELFGLHSSPRTAATDVFAFGPVVWQVMSGCAMSGQHDPVSGRPAKGWRPDTGALPPDAPRGVAALCERCWAEAPAARPAAAEVVDAMLALSEAGGVPEAALSIVRQRWAAVQAEARTAGAGAMPQAQAVIAAQPVVKATPAVPAASAQPAARAAPLLAGTPHATLTPLYMRNPPVWQTDATDIRLIPEDLAELFLPLTPQARAAPTLAVCVPFYSEDGYALRRGIEALACQRADLRRYWARCKTASPGALPELHVFAVADGWKKDDGSDILASSMLEEIIALYGDSLDVEALVDYMEGKEGGGEEQSPDAVLIQFAVDVPGVGLTQSPLLIDVTWAANMDCREGPPESGVVPMAMRQADAAEAAAQEQGAAARQLKSAEALAQLQPGGREKRVGARAAATSAAVSAEDEAALAPEQPLFVTLMIKRQNGRKHHSQQWYFEAWAPVLRIRSLGACMYYMSTDAGTLFAPFCLAELWEHMDTHPSCAACTGHQRIMSKNDQADPNRSDAETYAEGFLRAVQGYDFESGLCVFNGMHALAGFLPVVPGPCGFFRAAALTDSIIEQVRTICTTPARDDGLVQGNLKIAEDRILSYLLLLADDAQGKGSASVGRERLLAGGGGTQWQTGWVPSTKFFFEAETTLKELVLQRRRWLNGTQAGYIWLLSNRALWHAVCSMRFMAIKVLALSLLQVRLTPVRPSPCTRSPPSHATDGRLLHHLRHARHHHRRRLPVAVRRAAHPGHRRGEGRLLVRANCTDDISRARAVQLPRAHRVCEGRAQQLRGEVVGCAGGNERSAVGDERGRDCRPCAAVHLPHRGRDRPDWARQLRGPAGCNGARHPLCDDALLPLLHALAVELRDDDGYVPLLLPVLAHHAERHVLLQRSEGRRPELGHQSNGRHL